MLVVFSPSSEEVPEILSQLTVRNYHNAVLIDVTGSFAKSNEFIPEESAYHCFLTDIERHPVFVGDPLASSAMWNLFIGKISGKYP
jgi:hypothetical protein